VRPLRVASTPPVKRSGPNEDQRVVADQNLKRIGLGADWSGDRLDGDAVDAVALPASADRGDAYEAPLAGFEHQPARRDQDARALGIGGGDPLLRRRAGARISNGSAETYIRSSPALTTSMSSRGGLSGSRSTMTWLSTISAWAGATMAAAARASAARASLWRVIWFLRLGPRERVERAQPDGFALAARHFAEAGDARVRLARRQGHGEYVTVAGGDGELDVVGRLDLEIPVIVGLGPNPLPMSVARASGSPSGPVRRPNLIVIGETVHSSLATEPG
jgi:hypothetical protein